MGFLVKRLGLGIGLIVVASGILLATDRVRKPAGERRVWRVALLQHASTAVLDEGRAGIIDGLAAAGFREGDNLELNLYNAENDIGTANTMARKIIGDPYDLVISNSTLSLQAVANANTRRRMPHVFALVADPFSAGVGLDRADPMKHPPYLVGQGIFLPVGDCFRLARQMNPGLKSVGVVWNPSESNSRAFTENARVVCKELGIELLEATADNSAAVQEAANALISRGAQAIWMGGDVTVMVAIDTLISTARKAGVPVFTITPGKPERGTLFDIGVNFHECGKLAGQLAGQVLHGADPATLPIRDVLDLVPRRLVVNRQALGHLKGGWRLPDEVVQKAALVVDEQGKVHETGRKPS